MSRTRILRLNTISWSIVALLILALMCASCGGDDDDDNGGSTGPSLPQLAPAVGAPLASCEELVAQFTYANTQITSAETVPAGTLTIAGNPIDEHCLVKGKMNERTGVGFPPVGAAEVTYAIGFEMRLPKDWNGRFFYQANGGIDGSVVTATGRVLGGGATTSGLSEGFAVISSDAGHSYPHPFWGLDPQARLDYGYNAVATLTPMAKALIEAAYGKAPDRSYFVGCSNGGRHAMVAAARFADQYDGILAGNPGFNLPQAAVAQLYGVQQYTNAATALNGDGDPDIYTAVSPAEFSLIGQKVLAQCDGLDGAADGIAADTVACQDAFELTRDVPTCADARDGTCLDGDQMTAVDNVMTGARNSAGEAVYKSFPYDPGIAARNWASWEYDMALQRDPGAVAFIFTTPPSPLGEFLALGPGATGGYRYAMNFSMDTDAPRIFDTDDTYTVAPMTYMTPPNPTNLATLRNRGAKLMVIHGVADGVFSPNDTMDWYEGLDAANKGKADEFARLYLVPGMNHCGGGPATDQFDALTALIDWVENGVAPDRIIASARGAGNPGGENDEVPADWAPDRTRPLCPYPQVAVYNRTGSLESADSFTCK